MGYGIYTFSSSGEYDIDIKVTTPDSKRVKAFRDIVCAYDKKASFSVKGIKDKRIILTAVIQYAQNSENSNSDDSIEKALYQALHDEVRCAEMLTLLGKIKEWCNYRDEIVHALMNKNVDSLLKEAEQKAEEGHLLFRELDKHVRWIERKKIRKALGME